MFSFLLSVAIFAYLRITIEDDTLLSIRSQQLYGFTCLIFWYIALIISPIGSLIGKRRMKYIEFARRAIGVSAFYFAALHASVALFGQLGGIGQLQYLPALFQWSLLAGATALVVLGILAATSFDIVIRFMTFRKWKWLHRFIYIAGILAILHVWTIGTHLAYVGMQISGFSALSFLIGLEVLRAAKKMNSKNNVLSRAELGVVALTIWVTVSVALLAMPVLVQNYHSRHLDHSSSNQEHE